MYKNNTFSKRIVICYFVIVLLFLSCILRVAITATTDYSEVYLAQNSLKLKITDLRGTIFDCNRLPMTNNEEKIIASVSPTPTAITAISSVLKGEELKSVLEKLKGGKPVLCEVPKKIVCDGIVCTTVYENSNDLATHILGYTNSESKGVSGLELAYEELLNPGKSAYIAYECNAKGEVLEGAEPIVDNDTSVRGNGVVATIDTNIQVIAQECAESIETGAVIVAEASTGKIRALVSRPDFELENLTEYLESSDSPLFNRAINAYNVGSVFKPCVAVAGIESDKGNFTHICTGTSKIIDRFFKCHKYDGHGRMNLCSALAHSCNTYFYNFAVSVGKDEIYNAASSLKFGKELKICDGIYTKGETLPEKDSLINTAQLANFSIGQGKLLASPIAMLNLYCSIASNGTYFVPSVVEGTIENSIFKKYDKGNPTRAMTADTARILREDLKTVLTEGTGKEAQPKSVSAAGKTATAQTGKYENGVEICEGWFCGFFPSDKPKYVVIVFSENTLRQTESCSKVFANIADNITALSIDK